MLSTVLTAIKAFLVQYKLYGYVLLLLCIPALFIGGCVYGENTEKVHYYQAVDKDNQRQTADNNKNANQALKEEAAIAKNDAQLESSKKVVSDKINELAKDNPCGTSKLSDAERVYLQSLIDKANQ